MAHSQGSGPSTADVDSSVAKRTVPHWLRAELATLSAMGIKLTLRLGPYCGGGGVAMGPGRNCL